MTKYVIKNERTGEVQVLRSYQLGEPVPTMSKVEHALFWLVAVAGVVGIAFIMGQSL